MINSNSIPISGSNNNWTIMNKGFVGVYDWFTIQYGGVDKVNIDNTGKMSLLTSI